MTSPAPTSGGGEFVLDLDKADIAIRSLENVYAELASIRTDASRLASTERTAQDAVSLEAFDLLSQRADGAPGSLGVALEGAMQHVQGLIEQMRSDVAEQVALDARGARAAAGRA